STFITADYFDIGFNASACGEYYFYPAGYSLTLGGLFDFTFFNASGISEQTKNIIGSFGLTSTFSPPLRTYLSSILTVSTGVSYFRAVTDIGTAYTSVIPFFSGGIGLAAEVSPVVSLAAKVDYRVYMEKTIVLTGFLPSIALQFNL
ncbi:MAG TPA: hypothetical protein DCO79_02070, partial [Spirochaeta sp.]|nr:hypothetical protein [Spirochaeta sp.]